MINQTIELFIVHGGNMDLLTPNEVEYLNLLKSQGYSFIQRLSNGQLFVHGKFKNSLLIDSTYFECIPNNHSIDIDYLLTVIAGIKVPVLYETVEVPIIKYRETISKKRLTEWLDLLKERHYSELRSQLEKEIKKIKDN